LLYCDTYADCRGQIDLENAKTIVTKNEENNRKTDRSSAGIAALVTARKTVLCGCVCIEAVSYIAVINALTIPPVVST